MIVGADITHCNSPLLFSSPEGTWNTSNFHNKSIVSFYCDQHNNTAITNTHAVSVFTAICALLVCRVMFPESLEVIMHKTAGLSAWGFLSTCMVTLEIPPHINNWKRQSRDSALERHKQRAKAGTACPDKEEEYVRPDLWYSPTLAVQVRFQTQLPFTMSWTWRSEVSLKQCATTKCTLTMHSKAVSLYHAWCEIIQFHECNVVAFVGAQFGAKVNDVRI